MSNISVGFPLGISRLYSINDTCMCRMSKRIQLTLFECSASFSKRAQGSSGPTATTSSTTQLKSLPSSQVSEVCDNNDAYIISDSVSSVSSFTANLPAYSCPTPSHCYLNSDEEPILPMAKFSGDSDSSQHSIVTVLDTIPGPPTMSIPSTIITIPSTITSISSTTVVAQPNTLSAAAGSTNTTVPNDIAQTAAFSPVRPVNVKFYATKFGSTTRTFNVAWYDKFNWLEYSIQRDACFCYPCRMFGTSNSYGRSRPESTFTVTGFRNWKKATGKDGVLNRHASSVAHRQAEVAWHQYKCNSEQGTSITDRMNCYNCTE